MLSKRARNTGIVNDATPLLQVPNLTPAKLPNVAFRSPKVRLARYGAGKRLSVLSETERQLWIKLSFKEPTFHC